MLPGIISTLTSNSHSRAVFEFMLPFTQSIPELDKFRRSPGGRMRCPMITSMHSLEMHNVTVTDGKPTSCVLPGSCFSIWKPWWVCGQVPLRVSFQPCCHQPEASYEIGYQKNLHGFIHRLRLSSAIQVQYSGSRFRFVFGVLTKSRSNGYGSTATVGRVLTSNSLALVTNVLSSSTVQVTHKAHWIDSNAEQRVCGSNVN
jgi:hypothetical protein